MVTNLETRQNDVVETSNNSWWGLLTEMYRDFKKLVKRKVEKNEKKANEKKQEEQRKKEENEKNQRFKEDFVKKRAEKADRIYKDQQEQKRLEKEHQEEEKLGDSRDLSECSEEVVEDIKLLDDKIKTYRKLCKENGFESHIFNLGRWFREHSWISLYDDSGKQICRLKYNWKKDSDVKNRWPKEPEVVYSYSEAKASCVIRDPSGSDQDVVLDPMTIWDFRMAAKMINIYIDNKTNEIQNTIKEIKEKEQRTKKAAMERIAWQQIAQNNEEYHQQEVQQADADLESQLWDLA